MGKLLTSLILGRRLKLKPKINTIMKRISLIIIAIIAVLSSCKKPEEVEPDATPKKPVYESIYFRAETSNFNGNEFITINGVTTHKGDLSISDWLIEVSNNLPVGITLEQLQVNYIAVSGIMTYDTRGKVWVGEY